MRCCHIQALVSLIMQENRPRHNMRLTRLKRITSRGPHESVHKGSEFHTSPYLTAGRSLVPLHEQLSTSAHDFAVSMLGAAAG